MPRTIKPGKFGLPAIKSLKGSLKPIRPLPTLKTSAPMPKRTVRPPLMPKR